jgi:hypothetical protein
MQVQAGWRRSLLDEALLGYHTLLARLSGPDSKSSRAQDHSHDATSSRTSCSGPRKDSVRIAAGQT